MSQHCRTPRAIDSLVTWVLPGAGTNGYITSWGPALSGVPATVVHT